MPTQVQNMPSFKCADLKGMESCKFSAKDKNMDKLMGKKSKHANVANDIKEISEDLMEKIKAVIK